MLKNEVRIISYIDPISTNDFAFNLDNWDELHADDKKNTLDAAKNIYGTNNLKELILKIKANEKEERENEIVEELVLSINRNGQIVIEKNRINTKDKTQEKAECQNKSKNSIAA